MQEETDRQVESLDQELSRRLDDTYDRTAFCDLQNRIEQERNAGQKKRTETETEQTEITEKLIRIPTELAELQRAGLEKQQEAAAAEKELERYRSRKAAMERLCRQYGLRPEQCFQDGVLHHLEGEKQSIQTEERELLRQLTVAEEEIKAAERGSVHVPQAVIDCLNGLGIQYTTCEKYLLEQVSGEKLEREECLRILREYPAAAYGIMMDRHSLEEVFSSGQTQWLPAMVPVFTPEQMEQILAMKMTYSDAIAFYSEEYFADPGHYLANLTGRRLDLLKRRSMLEQTEAELDRQISEAKEFCYSERWEEEQLARLHQLQSETDHWKEEQNKLQALQRGLQEKQDELHRAVEEIRRELDGCDRKLERIRTILQRLETEEKQVQAYRLKREEEREAEQNVNDLRKEQDTLLSRKEELDGQLLQMKNLLERLEEARAEVDGAEEGTPVPGEWRELLTSYQQLRQAAGAELEKLNSEYREAEERCRDCKKEISRRGLREEEYCNAVYSKELAESLEARRKELKVRVDEASNERDRVRREKDRTELRREAAEKETEQYGGILEKSEVGTRFHERLTELREEQNRLTKEREACSEELNRLDRTEISLSFILEPLKRPEEPTPVSLEGDYSEQSRRMTEAFRTSERRHQEARKEVQTALDRMNGQFGDGTCDVAPAVAGMRELLSKKKTGDVYFTLWNSADDYMKNTLRAIGEIETTLRDFVHYRGDLLHQCTLQGRRIYEGLRQMESSSRVAVYAGKDRKKMLRFDIPEHINEEKAEAEIGHEIDQGVRELLALREKAAPDADISKVVRRVVGSRTLLRRYIGQDMIRIKAYKIDQNPGNAGYRTWEATQVNNSGAEKFVVYFTIILSLMNYTRGTLGGIGDGELYSALILDNPFGATSSRHILAPMFSIARHFRVQMVCLSDINKADVVSCFEVVIKAIVKRLPMSNRELLSHEGNEAIEHGFYRTEQISLF